MKNGHFFFAFKLLCAATLITFPCIYWSMDNVSQDTEQALPPKSCCKPFVHSSVCGSDNCTWTCHDYYPMTDQFVSSLGNEVFFHETSGSSLLKYRQACSVESLARSNPQLAVNVLMITPKDIQTTRRPISDLLAHYPNIKFKAIDIGGYFLGTPLEKWYFCTDWLNGRYAVSHLSDALRFLTLYKYGGYYFDLDFIVMQSLEKYRNFTAAESESTIAAGVIHFDYDHPLRTGAIEEFRTTYRKDLWGNNGPGVIQRSLIKYCNQTQVKQMYVGEKDACHGFTLYRPQNFYPIFYPSWREYFNEKRDDEVQKVIDGWLKNGVVGAHVWNKLSSDALILKNTSSLYTKLMKLYCPITYSIAPNSF